jgi:hypothetical protein
MEKKTKNKSFTLIEFQKLFPDEEACLKYLEAKRWGEGFCCSRCGHNAASILTTRGRRRECLGCGYQESVTSNTIFHKTRTPLLKWFYMIFFLAIHKKPPSVLQLQKDLGIGSYKTAWAMAGRIRAAMAQETQEDQLAGLLELDDAYYGGVAQGKRGRGADGKKAVVVAVSKDEAWSDKGERPHKIAFQVADTINADVIDQLSRRQIVKGSKVVTDGLAANTSAMKRREGEVRHQSVVLNGDKKKIQGHFKWVHVTISNSKRLILGIHHSIAPKNLVGYLSEFAWRFNRRNSPFIFHQLTSACLKRAPITLQDLLADEGMSALVE